MKTFAEFYSRFPNLAFVKTRIKVTDQSQLVDENFILEEDTPPLAKGFSVIMPLAKDDYPKIFKMATAMEAGMYAMDICEDMGLEIRQAVLYEVLNRVEESL